MHSAEPLFVTWLREILKTYPNDTSLHKDITTLITSIDRKRSLSFTVSPKDRALFFPESSHSSLGMPGMRVFHAMLYMYSIRGSSSRCTALLRFIESRQYHQDRLNAGIGDTTRADMMFPVRLDNMVYHRTISVSTMAPIIVFCVCKGYLTSLHL